MHSLGYVVRHVKTEQGWRWLLEHRLIWADTYGPIPRGYVVHHRNGDRVDNRLENLELLLWGEHTKLHSPQEFGRRGGLANRGRTKTPEHIAKIAESQRRSWASGKRKNQK